MQYSTYKYNLAYYRSYRNINWIPYKFVICLKNRMKCVIFGSVLFIYFQIYIDIKIFIFIFSTDLILNIPDDTYEKWIMSNYMSIL